MPFVNLKQIIDNELLPEWVIEDIEDINPEYYPLGTMITHLGGFDMIPFEQVAAWDLVQRGQSGIKQIPYAAALALQWDYNLYKLDKVTDYLETLSFSLVTPVARWFVLEREKFLKRYQFIYKGGKPIKNKDIATRLQTFGMNGLLMQLVDHDPIRFEQAKKLPVKVIFDLLLHKELTNAATKDN